MPLYLVSVDHPEFPVTIDKPILLIGRQAECDVILTCSRKVSRRHCCVIQISDWYVLRDLGSTNGISINGESIANEAKFEVGDQISVGDVAFDLVEGKFDVPKGKVCIGPKLTNRKSSGAEEGRRERRSKAESFRGIPSSRGRRDKADKNEKRRLADVAAEHEDDETTFEEPEPANQIGPPDDFGSETFGSDAGEHLDDKIEETFGSDMPGSDVGEGPFSFMDEDDFYESDDEEPAKREGGRPPRTDRPANRKKTADVHDDALDDETEAYDDDSDVPGDFVYEDDEVQRPVRKRKQRKQRPRDASLADDERLQDDVEVKRSGDGNSNNADSIIELDEFDLLD